MIEGSPHTWSCPACGRRVPLRAPSCHCGTTRAQAEEMAAATAAVPARRPVPRRPAGPGLRAELAGTMGQDVKLLAGVGALVVVAGLGWLVFGPSRPTAIPPVLGFVDQGPPPPVAKKTLPARPPFKLPWWK